MEQIEELYKKYGKRIFNYFYYLTYDLHKANDLTQETFYQVVLSIVKFKGKCSASTWLYSIARNTYLKSLRKEKQNNVELNDAAVAGLNLNLSASPEELMMRKDTINSVKKAISKLPEHYATVLVLRDKEGLSYAQISQITGMSESMVKVNIFRARQKFKEEFKKNEEYFNKNC